MIRFTGTKLSRRQIVRPIWNLVHDERARDSDRDRVEHAMEKRQL